MKKRAEKIRELAGQMENEKSAYERMSKAHKVVAATGEFFRAYFEKMQKNRLWLSSDDLLAVEMYEVRLRAAHIMEHV